MTALGRFGRLAAIAESLSSLRRIKRASHKNIGDSRYLAIGGLLRLTELAKEVVKDWRGPAAPLLRLAMPFRLSAPIRVTSLPLPTDIRQSINLDIIIAESLELPDGLGAR